MTHQEYFRLIKEGKLPKEKLDWKNDSYLIVRYAPELFDPEKFNWNENTVDLVEYLVEKFDSSKANWEELSYHTFREYPYIFDSDFVDWRNSTDEMKLKPILFDRKVNLDEMHQSYFAYRDLPELVSSSNLDIYNMKFVFARALNDIPRVLDETKFNWEAFSSIIIKIRPEFFDPEKFNWLECSFSLIELHPEFFDPEKFNWQTSSYAVVDFLPEKFDPRKANWNYATVSSIGRNKMLLEKSISYFEEMQNKEENQVNILEDLKYLKEKYINE